MKHTFCSLTRLLLLGFVFLTTACTQMQPKISHAHLGHALTTWHDTPGQRGLLVVAREQANIALRESTQATKALRSTEQRTHIANIAQALSPVETKGYGVVRALENAVEHIDFAATSGDASENFINAAAEISAASVPMVDGLRRALTLARVAEKQGDVELAATVARLDSGLRQLINGADYDGNGEISLGSGEGGLAQIEQRLARAVADERPSYQPLPRYLILGLFRLPGGGWAFKPASAAPASGTTNENQRAKQGGYSY